MLRSCTRLQQLLPGSLTPQVAGSSTAARRLLTSSARYNASPVAGRTRAWNTGNPPRHASQRNIARRLSTAAEPQPYGLRIRTVVAALLVLGLGATAWGLYDFYMALTMWPEEVRGDLRAGLRAKHRGDLKLSQRYLHRAWTTVQTLPLALLAPEPHLKITGVAISLAEVLEKDGRHADAYAVYEQALSLLRQASQSEPTPQPQGEPRPPPQPNLTPPRLSTREHMRAASLSLKLADLAQSLSRPPAEERRWLNLAVAAVVPLIPEPEPDPEPEKGKEKRKGSGVRAACAAAPLQAAALARGGIGELDVEEIESLRKAMGRVGLGEGAGRGAEDSNLSVSVLDDGEVPLPAWTTLESVAAPFERLGEFYARHDSILSAGQMYATTIALLSDEFVKESRDPMNICRRAQVANNFAELIMRSENPGDRKDQADFAAQFAVRAIHDANHVLNGESSANEENKALCASVIPVALCNLGSINEISGRRDEARRNFLAALAFSKHNGFKEGIQAALAGLRRMEREERRMSSLTRSVETADALQPENEGTGPSKIV